MRKLNTPLLLCGILLSGFGNLLAQTYQVQLATFTETIHETYFTYAGYSNVYADQDYNGFTRYTLGEFFTEEEAKQTIETAKNRGFYDAHIVELDQPLFAYTGDALHLPLIKVPKKEGLYIRSVAFDADALHLNRQLIKSLEEALVIMQTYADLKLKIVGHTDKIGMPHENKAISKERARIIQNFLLANDIPAYRVQMKVLDKPSPEVYFDGKGLPKNRVYNRRIIIALVDQKDEIVLGDFQARRTVKMLSVNLKNVFRFIDVS